MQELKDPERGRGCGEAVAQAANSEAVVHVAEAKAADPAESSGGDEHAHQWPLELHELLASFWIPLVSLRLEC